MNNAPPTVLKELDFVDKDDQYSYYAKSRGSSKILYSRLNHKRNSSNVNQIQGKNEADKMSNVTPFSDNRSVKSTRTLTKQTVQRFNENVQDAVSQALSQKSKATTLKKSVFDQIDKDNQS